MSPSVFFPYYSTFCRAGFLKKSCLNFTFYLPFSVIVVTPNHNENAVIRCDVSWSLTLKCRICGSTVSDASVGCRRAHISALRFITEAGRVAETISSPAGGMYHNRDDTSSLLSFLYPQRTPQLIARIAAFLDAEHSCRPSSTLSLLDVLIWQILHKQNVKCCVCCLWL